MKMFLVKSSVALVCVLGLLGVDGDVISKLCSNRQCLCRPHPTHAVYMNCSGGNFTHIPTPPHKSLPLYLALDQNILTNVTGEMFRNISKSSLRSLLFFANRISYISSDAFNSFFNLDRIVFSSNNISRGSLASAVASLGNVSIRSLTISHMNVTLFPQDIFLPLAQLPHLTLSLVNNQLKMDQVELFEPLKGLAYLNLRANSITHMSIMRTDFVQDIQHLCFDYNRLEEFPQLCRNKTSHFPNLTRLEIMFNNIRVLSKSQYDCLDSLRELILDGNILLELWNNQFSGLKSLTSLRLSSIGCTLRKVEHKALNSSTLQHISYRNNHIHFNKSKEIPLTIFQKCPSLQYLNLNSNSFSNLLDVHYDTLFLNLANLKVLNIGDCRIKHIPRAISSHLKHLIQFDLSSIEIKDVQPGVFNNMTKLTHLFLAYNEITSVNKSSFPPHFMKGSGYVDLSGNIFSCGCESLWFIETSERDLRLFRAEWHKEGYICNSPSDLHGMHLLHVRISEQKCLLSWSILMILLVGSCVLITLLVILSLLYYYRWNLMYLVFMMKHREREVVDRRQFLYDVFVAYNYDDLAWVKQHLMPVLEGSDGLKLCIHNRDFEVGRMIVDNIVESVENSRKVIIVLSNNFAKSGWWQFELHLIQRHVMECGQRLLVVVMLEDIDPCHVTKSLRAMLQTTTYLEWGEESHTRQAFFNRLRLLEKRPTVTTSCRRRRLSV